jgi:predicted metalloprotease with PDZ domain
MLGLPHSKANRFAVSTALCLTCLTLAGTIRAQTPTESARAVAYPGVMHLVVDASDIEHRIVRVQQQLAVAPGKLRLYFPRFPPGTHGPYGAVHRLAGLKVMHDGTALPWVRDTADPFAFDVEVPERASTLALEFQYLMQGNASEHAQGVMSRDFVNLAWSQTLMYPQGWHVGAIPVTASLKLPPGWQHATSLRSAGRQGDVVRFETTSLETLVDSPVFAAPYMVRHELDSPGTPRAAALVIFAARERDLESKPEQIEAHRKLVEQAARLFGSRHFERYEFLLGLFDDLGFHGLEHHQSSENLVDTKYFKDWDKRRGARELLPHEFAHSWNGKFRRPADLLTPDFHTPMRNSLLWLYEGQTEYWGAMLAVRSGLTTPEQLRDDLARTIAKLSAAPGRAWRNLQDTTNEGVMRGRTIEHDWPSWQRGEDYYDEAALIWLEADMLIRDKTSGARSLDDFARAFFGVDDGRVLPLAYTFDDVVATLNEVVAHDWRAFLRERIDGKAQLPHLSAGVERAGWRLAWADKPSDFEAADATSWRGESFEHSLGFSVDKGGKTIRSVLWDGPAFKAGLPRQGELIAVNGMVFTGERLREALLANKEGKAPVQLIVKDGERVRSFGFDFRQGPRYPRLERIDGTADRLDAGVFRAR